jgi:hypothetical protein
MAVVIETAASPSSAWAADDPGTALALDSLGIRPAEAFTPLPAQLVQGIVALSGLITGLVWLLRLQGRG